MANLGEQLATEKGTANTAKEAEQVRLEVQDKEMEQAQLQNELARLQKYRTVRHANGEVSVLPPAGEFMRSSALNEPLLEKGERKLDEYGWAART